MLEKVLAARESRAEIRKGFAKQEFCSISLSFNIPGYPKSDDFLAFGFLGVVYELLSYLKSNRIECEHTNFLKILDAAGDFFITPIVVGESSLSEIKVLLEKFESNHPLSRLIDVDLFDDKAKPVSSGKSKKCFICSKSAIECMRQKNHSIEELREYINKQMQFYIDIEHEKNILKSITSFATRALMYEVSVTPKPGLVDRYSQGSHKDMDYFSFVSSTAALSYFWRDISKLAFGWDGKEKEITLPALRSIGIEMESEMLRATEGVNTQKGAIFILGFISFAVSYLLKNKIHPTDKCISDIISYLNSDVVNKELNNANKLSLSHGDAVFMKYGEEFGGGIRKEMESGLPIIFNNSLPYLKAKGFIETTDEVLNKELQDVLLLIMSVNNDTNILFRSNHIVLREMKELALRCVNSTGLERIDNVNLLSEYCEKHYISPGGSADLLAATCFIYWIQEEFISYNFM